MPCDCGAYDCKRCGPLQGYYGTPCETCGRKDYDCDCHECEHCGDMIEDGETCECKPEDAAVVNRCEVDDCLDECQMQERTAYKLDLQDRINRNDFDGAGAAVAGAMQRGLITGHEAADDQARIWTKHQNITLALTN